MDLDKLRKQNKVYNKKMRYTIGRQIHFILLDFQKPIKKFKYEQTEYLLYECKIIRRNSEDLEPTNYQLQIPIKKVWTKIYDELKCQNRLNEQNIAITISRNQYDNYNFNVIIHKDT